MRVPQVCQPSDVVRLFHGNGIKVLFQRRISEAVEEHQAGILVQPDVSANGPFPAGQRNFLRYALFQKRWRKNGKQLGMETRLLHTRLQLVWDLLL